MYALGGLGNLKDINDIVDATIANLYTQNRYEDGRFDFITHTGIEEVNKNNILMSY